MMKTLFSIVLVTACLYTNNLHAQASVTFSPAKPQPGEKISITCDAVATGLQEVDQPLAIAFLLEGAAPVAREVPLTRNGSSYTGSFPTTDTTLAVYLHFPKAVPSQKPGIWGYHTYLYNAAGQPLPGARKATGEMALQYGYLWGLEPGLIDCYQLAREDFALHPALKEKFQAYYLDVLAVLNKEEDKPALNQQLTAKLANPNSPEEALQMVKNVYTRLKEKDKMTMVDSVIRARYPAGTWIKSGRIMDFWREVDPIKKETLFKKLVADFPPVTKADTASFDNYAAMVARGYLQAGNLEKVKEYSHLIKNKTAVADLYNDVAWQLSGESVEAQPKEAAKGKEFSARSLELLEETKNDFSDRPSYYTEQQWKDRKKSTWYMYSDTYALLLYHLKDYKNAYTWQAKAVAGTKRNDVAMNESFAVYTEKVKGPQVALQELDSFVRTDKASPKMKEQFKRLYLANGKTENQWTTYIGGLEKEHKARKRAQIAKAMINDPAPAFSLKDLKGEDVSLASLKGKIVVVDFWATWCGPCLASFPSMKKAVEKYKDDPDVKFVFIDTRESGDRDNIKTKVAALIEKNAYPFHVLMDYDSKVIEAYKVPGIPTKFVIDRNSMVRFKMVGFGAGEDTVEEITTMIELARSGGAAGTKKGF